MVRNASELDRIVQGAMVNVIEPIFERDFAEHSYGFRPGRGCKDALRRVDHLLKAGFVWPDERRQNQVFSL